MDSEKDSISWKIIDKYFTDNPNCLTAHHLESFNDFFKNGIPRIFKENNPIRFAEREDENVETRNECHLYLGGKDGTKIYYGKPVIYDDNHTHFMFPNDARLRNMTYGTTIHYDVEVDFISHIVGKDKSSGLEPTITTMTVSKVYLGKFPIMLQSDLCILNTMTRDVRFNVGECRNDYGGYFVIDGKEKLVIPQEKFADNMLYIRKYKADDIYLNSAEIRSVSEDSSKPIRTSAVRLVAPTPLLTNRQIVVSVPNVKQPVPLMIFMRALGVISDKDIIKMCVFDLEKNSHMIDLFIPSVHDAGRFFTQKTALKYMAELTKRGTISSVQEILADYYLPHVGTMNFLEKAHFTGYMVYKMLKVYTGEERPTDRDNFQFKRIELTGTLLYDLFREYYLLQKKDITQKIDKEYYYHKGTYTDDVKDRKARKTKDLKPVAAEDNKYKDNFRGLIESNVKAFFKDRLVEQGFKKAFKGNWGSEAHTKRLGVVQDLNRLSWYTAISHLRKINLPLDSSAKVVGPRLLNSSQWAKIDPLDTPDGGNIGLHKHMSISAYVTSGSSAEPMIKWLINKTFIKPILECTTEQLLDLTKVFVNGRWIGVISDPYALTDTFKLYRRNGIIPIYCSARFDIGRNEIAVYTDAGRLCRPIYYIDKGQVSFDRPVARKMLENGKITWTQIVSGFNDKPANYDIRENKLYNIEELYPELAEKTSSDIEDDLKKNAALVDYIDTAEEESALVAMTLPKMLHDRNFSRNDSKSSTSYLSAVPTLNKYYTHLEIDPSLILGVMGNLIIYPENNPLPRNSFSCGQSKQAVSLYHSNYQMRIDKMGVVLNYGQIPLIKSRYLDYINREEQPYGVNAVVAIQCYTGYNVEDAILINKGSILRGLFRTTYFSMYEAREESAKVTKLTSSKFANIEKNNVIGKKKGYDYSQLDDSGLIRENTELNDKMILIGKINSNLADKDTWIDDSVKPKKGQLGYVDKSFITQGEEGFNVAKVRLREERIPSIGDKMASRSGQKGTIGLIIEEADMPFLEDGTRPDLIINPHAIPSRMTIGQIVESMFGIACVNYGAFGDCTAWQTKGSNFETYGRMLVDAGFHSSGTHIVYNGMTGEQIESNIYMGPTYYMRLKHMVKDKINFRARGPNQQLTRQPVQGRANDGGLRVGEMERDGICAHGLAYFLNESFLVRGGEDEYYMAVCNKTGAIAVYNEAKSLFLSPYSDGPIQFHTNPDSTMNVKTISRFGRSFSLLRIPYAFKLLIQELQCMNIQMRLITDDSADQLMSMSYSNNISKLLKVDSNSDKGQTVKKYIGDLRNRDLRNKLRVNTTAVKPIIPMFKIAVPESPSESPLELSVPKTPETPPYAPESPALEPVESPVYAPESPAFKPDDSPPYAPNSPALEEQVLEVDSFVEQEKAEQQENGTKKIVGL